MVTKDARASALARLADEAPPTFVATRKALASELKASGDAAGAKAVLARRRPSWTSWALGRVARGDATALRNVIAAHAALAAAVRAGEKIAAAQTAFSRALEATGRSALAGMAAAGHAGAAGEARKLRAALRLIAEQGERAVATVAAGDFTEPKDDASERDVDGMSADADAGDDDGGFLAAATASLAAKRPSAAAHPASAAKASRAQAARPKAHAKTEAAAAHKEREREREETARRHAAEAKARARAKADAQAKAREKERREIEAELARAEKSAARAAERVETIETELTEAIAARKEADARVKELHARLAVQR